MCVYVQCTCTMCVYNYESRHVAVSNNEWMIECIVLMHVCTYVVLWTCTCVWVFMNGRCKDVHVWLDYM